MATIEIAAFAIAIIAGLYTAFLREHLLAPYVALVMTSVSLSSLGVLALSKRMVFLAHAQSHAVLTSALFAALIVAYWGLDLFSPLFDFLTFAVLFALNLIVLNMSYRGYREDVATGIVISFQLPLAVVLIRLLESYASNPLAIFSGELTSISARDLPTILIGSLAALIVVLIFGTKYLYASFDLEYAEAIGLRTKLYDVLFIFAMTVASAISVKALGAFIPAVLIVAPGPLAVKISNSLSNTVRVAVFVGLLTASLAHLIYVAVGWIWPNIAVVLVLAVMYATASIWRWVIRQRLT